MELYASGFNAWGQLCFDHSALDEDDHPSDLRQFVRILAARTIENVQAFLPYTTVSCNGLSKTAGYSARDHSELHRRDPRMHSTLAEAANGLVAVRTASGAVKQFRSFKDLLNNSPGKGFPELQSCSQVVAYDAGFAALSTAGAVYTWGDERYEACLGRQVTDDSPADKPTRVTALLDLPTGAISKIAAGGYMVAALTTGNDLYLWGGHPGRKTVPVDVSDEPCPIVIEDHDIADVAVGEAHLIVLTTMGKVYVIGDNINGQLGLPVRHLETWTPIDLGLPERKKVTGVAAGLRNTFITVISAASTSG